MKYKLLTYCELVKIKRGSNTCRVRKKSEINVDFDFNIELFKLDVDRHSDIVDTDVDFFSNSGIESIHLYD